MSAVDRERVVLLRLPAALAADVQASLSAGDASVTADAHGDTLTLSLGGGSSATLVRAPRAPLVTTLKPAGDGLNYYHAAPVDGVFVPRESAAAGGGAAKGGAPGASAGSAAARGPLARFDPSEVRLVAQVLEDLAVSEKPGLDLFIEQLVDAEPWMAPFLGSGASDNLTLVYEDGEITDAYSFSRDGGRRSCDDALAAAARAPPPPPPAPAPAVGRAPPPSAAYSAAPLGAPAPVHIAVDVDDAAADDADFTAFFGQSEYFFHDTGETAAPPPPPPPPPPPESMPPPAPRPPAAPQAGAPLRAPTSESPPRGDGGERQRADSLALVGAGADAAYVSAVPAARDAAADARAAAIAAADAEVVRLTGAHAAATLPILKRRLADSLAAAQAARARLG
jgi:hypothetical protein